MDLALPKGHVNTPIRYKLPATLENKVSPNSHQHNAQPIKQSPVIEETSANLKTLRQV